MYAAAGGLSLAKRQERRNLKKQISAGDPHGHVIKPLKPPSSPLPPIRQSRYELHRSQLNLQQARYRQQQQQHQQHQSHLLTPHQAQYIVQGEEDERHLSAEDGSRSSARLNGRIASFGSCELDLYSESQQGKTAWQDRDRRNSSMQDPNTGHYRSKASEAHKRWMKRNRIHDSSFGGSSSDEDDDLSSGLYGHQSAAANGLLYVGLGTIAIGLVIAFVGTGEKGFKTLELRLIGPTLIGGGLFCCLVRVFLCVCPSKCLRRRNKHRHRHKDDTAGRHLNHHSGFFESDNKNGGAVSENIALVDRTSLPKKEDKSNLVTTSVTTAAAPLPSSSSDNNRRHNSMRQSTSTAHDDVLTCTTLFLQHEKQRAGSSKPCLPPPTINLPNYISDSDNEDDDDPLEILTRGQQSREESGHLLDLELQNLDAGSFDISSFKSSCKTPDRDIVLESPLVKSKVESKITKPRAPVNRSGSAGPSSATKRSGLSNPDPGAHMVEEELLLLDKDFDTKSKPLESILSSSPSKSGEKDDLIQNEIVLSPSKLQQDS